MGKNYDQGIFKLFYPYHKEMILANLTLPEFLKLINKFKLMKKSLNFLNKY